VTVAGRAPMGREQDHRSSPELLERRTLEQDAQLLAEVLRPGLRVLDVGCGSGSITAGIARAVQPGGEAVGLDRDGALIERGRTLFGSIPGLRLRSGSVLELDEPSAYDVVAAARALQWIPEADAALARMVATARPGGLVVVLDYDHADLDWRPAPPVSVRRFYDAFLAWRASGGLDNRMGSSLPDRFARAGLEAIRSLPADETSSRGDARFAGDLRIWAVVIADIGPAIVRAGHLADASWSDAVRDYETWSREQAEHQRMVLRAVTGRRPS
jgi:ubiquinone/menaquinone biosynthesis C-methylase UbiE